jgi:hypothetical protein
MYDDAGGDPIFYFKKVTQFVKASKTYVLCMKKKKYSVLVRGARTMHFGVGSKQFVSTCWRRVSLITTKSRPNIMKRDRLHKATLNRQGHNATLNM